MHHLTDEDLILHFYGEGGPSEERRIDDHLAACSECRQAWAELGDMLKLVDAAKVPEPGEGFERVMWARVQNGLPEARPKVSTSTWRWIPALGVAAAVVLAVAIGYGWRASHDPHSAAAPAASTTSSTSGPAFVRTSATDMQKTRERVLLTALSEHFQQTEVLLTEIMNAPDQGGSEADFERTSAGDLVASGRLYRVTAQENGDLQLARMLDDLEGVLVEVARSPEKVAPKDFQSLRTRIGDQNLLFKVRAVSTQIQQRQKSLISSE
ncbi:MAG TPA: hypothetical protein VJN96_00590 [Vicinamibacterales bacterium]|nr:hypothetical protein [Vicinamibacterales bacterium]